ncbi:proteasome regulatory particle base subunit rpn10, partial [Gonapodya sp. JEL0774]
MVLEATVVIVDNSEWARNGDYTPTRMEAQSDAVNLLFNAKTQSNPESTVGLMSMAGKGPEVLVTPSSEIGKILTAMHGVKIGGSPRFDTAVQIAQLVLKHRQNKNQRQRIIAFVGSPLAEDEKTLSRIAKKLKKNNVAVDVINFGEESENTTKLETFVQTVSSGDNSHLVSIPPGPHILSDILLSSPIISGEDGVPAGLASSGGGGFEFGVDPTLDPELALALRISLEEERARQEQVNGGSRPADGAAGGTDVTPAGAGAGLGGDDEDMLAQALAMSVGQERGDDVVMDELSEDDQIQEAI